MKNFRVINLEKHTDTTKYEKGEDGIYRKLDNGEHHWIEYYVRIFDE
jgi:hypothetical protein